MNGYWSKLTIFQDLEAYGQKSMILWRQKLGLENKYMEIFIEGMVNIVFVEYFSKPEYYVSSIKIMISLLFMAKFVMI